jgi:chloramphenicol-sensitive protein RarD
LHTLQALAAFILWGIFPLYWKLLEHVEDPVEIIGHRILWSLATLVLCVSFLGQWREVQETLANPKRIALAALAAVLISINWLVFIWAVHNQAVVDSSLGYFMNPLFSVVLGVVLFHEHLDRWQWLAVAVAAIGLCLSAISSERLWVSVVLASSFSAYGVVKKQTKLSAVSGLGMETAILAPIAIGYLTHAVIESEQIYSWDTAALLALGGPVTTVPLLLFASASKQVPLAVMGMLQYVGPSIQFAIGAFLDGEKIDQWRIAGFCCVWVALGIFSVVALTRWEQNRLGAEPEAMQAKLGGEGVVNEYRE